MRRVFAQLAALSAAFALLAAIAAMPAFADPRDFRVTNGSSMVLAHVYVATSDSSDWGDDILGQDVVDPGNYVNVTFGKFDSGSCLYDVQLVGQQGQTATLSKINLCNISTVTFTD